MKLLTTLVNSFVKACSKCGSKDSFKNCPAFGKVCYECGKQNHYSKYCKNKQWKNKKQHVENDKTSVNSRPTHSLDGFALNYKNSNGLMLKVKMFDKEIDFQLDTGAAISILSERQWIDLGKPKLNETDVQPTNFDGTIIKTLGQSYTKNHVEHLLL